MKLSKSISQKCIVLLLLVATLLTSCVRDDVPPEEQLLQFSDLLESADIEDVSLTIYYMSPFMLTAIPVSVDTMVYGLPEASRPLDMGSDENGWHQLKIVIDGERLEKHVDLLNQMVNTELVAVEKNSYEDIRIYYVFKSKNGEKIFDVALWDARYSEDGTYVDDCFIVNGIAVAEDIVFYEAIIPFLPDDELQGLLSYVNRRIQKIDY